jgi:hypothetical protein
VRRSEAEYFFNASVFLCDLIVQQNDAGFTGLFAKMVQVDLLVMGVFSAPRNFPWRLG